MEDRSPSGASIRLKMPILPGAKLRIDSLREQFLGVAIYCRADAGDYVLGIKRDAMKVNTMSGPSIPSTSRPISKWESAINVSHPFAAPKLLSMPHQPTRNRNEIPAANLNSAHMLPAHSVAHSASIPQPVEANVLRAPKLEKQSPSPGKERTYMPTKWLNAAAWRQKQDASNGNASNNAISTGAGAAQPDSAAGESAVPNAAAERLSATQGDLMSTDDIYRAAGILSPRMGYSITKVADMLESSHLRGLSDDMKRASVLMALDAAGIPVDDVLRDATLRQDAIDSYESAQRKLFEEFWAQKDEENSLIQAELDRSTALHLDRIKRNLDEVAREKVTFATWQSMKQQESQRIAEAAALCAPARQLAAREAEGQRTLAASAKP